LTLVPPAETAHTPEATLAGPAVVDAAAASSAPATIAIIHLFTSFPSNHSCLAVRPAKAARSLCDPSVRLGFAGLHVDCCQLQKQPNLEVTKRAGKVTLSGPGPLNTLCCGDASSMNQKLGTVTEILRKFGGIKSQQLATIPRHKRGEVGHRLSLHAGVRCRVRVKPAVIDEDCYSVLRGIRLLGTS
jgi:hypothetical protein